MKYLIYLLFIMQLCYAMEEVVVVPTEHIYTTEEITQYADELIRTAVLITFGTQPEDIYYVPHVKQSIGRHIASPDSSSEDDEETEETRRTIVQRFVRQKRRSLDGLDYSELRRWMLQELKSYNRATHKEIEKLQENAQAKEKELEDSKRKTRYALISTMVTTIGGIATAVTTFLLTYYLDQHSDN